jgi:type IV secretory pathway protease TraF
LAERNAAAKNQADFRSSVTLATLLSQAGAAGAFAAVLAALVDTTVNFPNCQPCGIWQVSSPFSLAN